LIPDTSLRQNCLGMSDTKGFRIRVRVRRCGLAESLLDNYLIHEPLAEPHVRVDNAPVFACSRDFDCLSLYQTLQKGLGTRRRKIPIGSWRIR
jgi:hypothetical protein